MLQDGVLLNHCECPRLARGRMVTAGNDFPDQQLLDSCETRKANSMSTSTASGASGESTHSGSLHVLYDVSLVFQIQDRSLTKLMQAVIIHLQYCVPTSSPFWHFVHLPQTK